jgi:hypothetical protein
VKSSLSYFSIRYQKLRQIVEDIIILIRQEIEKWVTRRVPQIPIIMAIIPMIAWNLPNHLATFSKLLPTAGILGRIPIASISPAMIFVISTITLSPMDFC